MTLRWRASGWPRPSGRPPSSGPTGSSSTARTGCSPTRSRCGFYGRLDHWQRVPGGELLADTAPWNVERLFFPHCKMEPPWGRGFAFAVDVSATYDRKRAALAEYGSIFRVEEGDRLLTLYEAEDAYMGRLFGVAYAETFKSQSPLLVTSPTVFLPALHA